MNNPPPPREGGAGGGGRQCAAKVGITVQPEPSGDDLLSAAKHEKPPSVFHTDPQYVTATAMMKPGLTRAVAITPLGPVTLDVSGPSAVAIDVAEAEVPELPEGMMVDGVPLLSVRRGEHVTPTSPVHVRASANQDGFPETGEWLDSMVFESAGGVLQVAMRDDDWLAGKRITAEPIHYERQGFRQTITEAAAGTVLYASVIWRVAHRATANDSSTWLAADLSLPIRSTAGGR